MELKSANSLSISNPWLVSGIGHVVAVALVVAALSYRVRPQPPAIDFMVVESPKVAPQAVTITKPKPVEQVKARQVYGISRKAVTSDVGVAVKQGNTLAKTPDDEKLNEKDVDSLPIPTEDYLVTQMPQLLQEVFVPFPPNAKKRGVQGAVTMDLLIDQEGRVRKVDLIDGPDEELNAAAVAAAAGFKFKPAYIQDKPVSVRIRYAYRFIIRG